MRFRILGLGVMWGGNEHLDQWSGPPNFSLGARVRSSKLAFLTDFARAVGRKSKTFRAVELGRPKHERSMGRQKGRLMNASTQTLVFFCMSDFT